MATRGYNSYRGRTSAGKIVLIVVLVLVLLGAVGGPKWGSDKPAEQRPETALLAIRKDLGLYANLRPAALRPAMAGACPLKKETAEKGIDLMMVRELTGGIYFGERGRREGKYGNFQSNSPGLQAMDADIKSSGDSRCYSDCQACRRILLVD